LPDTCIVKQLSQEFSYSNVIGLSTDLKFVRSWRSANSLGLVPGFSCNASSWLANHIRRRHDNALSIRYVPSRNLSRLATRTIPSHSPRNDHPRGHCQFIGGTIVVVIVLSSLHATRLNGLMRMRRARYFFFRVGPNVLPASRRCDATLSE